MSQMENTPGVELSPAERENVMNALSQNFLFADLKSQEVEIVAAEVGIEEFSTGAVIVRDGDEADTVYLVVRGAVNVLKGNEQFLCMLGANAFFGEMALFTDDAKRTANCIAAEPTLCVTLTRPQVHAFCDEYPALGVKIYRSIIKALSTRLQATSADLAMLMAGQVRSQTDVSSLFQKAKKNRQEGPGKNE